MAIALQDHRVIPLDDLVIDISEDDDASQEITADEFGRFESLTIYAPSTLTGVITVEVIGDPDADETVDGNWQTLQSAGNDVRIGTDEAITITPLNALAIRLKSDSAEGADRTFNVTGRIARVASP